MAAHQDAQVVMPNPTTALKYMDQDASTKANMDSIPTTDPGPKFEDVIAK